MSAIIHDTSQRVDPLGEGVADFSPMWITMFVRIKRPLTYDRVAQKSRSSDGAESAQERGKPLIVTDAQTVNVNRPKGSYVKSSTIILPPGDVDYQTQIHPGDGVAIWMFDNQEDGLAVLQDLKDGKSANGWLQGLKFIGKVNSRFKMGAQTDAGKPTVMYQVTANGFTEFDASLFWDPYLANSADKEILTWMTKVGVGIDKFLAQYGLDVNQAIPQLMEVFFGKGLPQIVADPLKRAGLFTWANTQAITGLTEGSGEAPFAFVIPETIGRILGVHSRGPAHQGVLAAMDIWRVVCGIQGFGGAQQDLFTPNDPPAEVPDPFWPTSLQPMLGTFNPSVPDLSGKTVWSVLSTYLNQTINEMYTALKPGPDRNLLPHLVVRQIPFSTPLAPQDRPVTRFLDLPRWRTPAQMIQRFHIGSSDALRINFVHITAVPTQQTDRNYITRGLTNPETAPRRDDQDIQRSGLRPEISQVNCGIGNLHDPLTGPGAYTAIRADIVMGQHLALTGTIETYGIQEPISEGDNFEFDGVVAHIDMINHTCTITADGRKHFTTTMQVTHGMAADADEIPQSQLRGNQLHLYAGIIPGKQLTLFDYGRTNEGQVDNENLDTGFARTEEQNPHILTDVSELNP